MKAAARAPNYLPPQSLREDDSDAPSEMEAQALWFEQLSQVQLITDDGRIAEVIQPGFWNHTGGPDFHRAVIRFVAPGGGEPQVAIGNVEVHLRPTDWHAHGHDADPAYDETILHVVWENAGRKAFFPATSQFRRVPQVVLSSQLVAPWPELRPLCRSLAQRPLPGAVPGRCSSQLTRLPADEVAEILRAAGMFRLQQKARRWYWRQRLAGPEQAGRVKLILST